MYCNAIEVLKRVCSADLWLPRGRGDGGRVDWEFGISRHKILMIDWVNNQVLLQSTEHGMLFYEDVVSLQHLIN